MNEQTEAGITRREASSRACKAYRLVLALEAHARPLKIDTSTVAGVNELIELAGCLDSATWNKIAARALPNQPDYQPSRETIRLVGNLLREKASYLFDQPFDKSVTYSERPGTVEVCP